MMQSPLQSICAKFTPPTLTNKYLRRIRPFYSTNWDRNSSFIAQQTKGFKNFYMFQVVEILRYGNIAQDVLTSNIVNSTDLSLFIGNLTFKNLYSWCSLIELAVVDVRFYLYQTTLANCQQISLKENTHKRNFNMHESFDFSSVNVRGCRFFNETIIYLLKFVFSAFEYDKKYFSTKRDYLFFH